LESTATEKEASRVEAMIEQIGKITGTSIEIEALRPLVLECVKAEHKDAWKHTLAVIKAKMVCDKKLKIPNLYAAKVLAKALKSPAPPPKAPVKAQEPPAETHSETHSETLVTQGGSPAPSTGPAFWALRRAQRELTTPQFFAQHKRYSAKADWEARAREIEAAQGT
jgi:hypothetical protein